MLNFGDTNDDSSNLWSHIMKIVTFTMDFLPEIGGVQTYLYEILNRLGSTHEITVVTPIEGKLPSKSTLNKVALKQNNAISYWRMARQLNPKRILVGHAHPQLLLAARLCFRQDYATVAYGNDFLAAQRRWHRPFFNHLLAKSNPLITITNANANRLQTLGLPDPIVVYPATDPKQFTPTTQAKENPTPILLTVSRLVPRKGIDLVIKSLPTLLEGWPTLRYTVIGSGPDRKRLQHLAQEMNVVDAVHFLGRVSNERLIKSYQRADVFVMPSREIVDAGSVEGFGIVYLEASASGLPVVAGHSGGAVEAVRDGETGFLVPPDDAAALAKILHRLLDDEELRRRLGQNGRAWVESEMNWDRAAQQMAQALQLL